MFELCLFDLDDTLVATSDLKYIREKGKRNNSGEYLEELTVAYNSVSKRVLISEKFLEGIREDFPNLELGVFTRSPRSYCEKILELAYPSFEWDVVVAYEDVRRTKPHGDGIIKAMDKLDFEDLDKVALIGDTQTDVASSYNAGTLAVIARTNWPWKHTWEHWKALELIPDAIISRQEKIKEFLAAPHDFLPDLESLLDNKRSSGRFDEIGHFVPKELGGVGKKFPIHVAGRYFSHSTVNERRKWHSLTESIIAHKDSMVFALEWVETVRNFLRQQVLFRPIDVYLTAIPHRPDRPPRLEAFLAQIKTSVDANPIRGINLKLQPTLFRFHENVKSQHREAINRIPRFENIRDNLLLNEPIAAAENDLYIVLDDVTTTGASLIYATILLEANGHKNVKCLSIAKNVGDIIYGSDNE